MAIMERSGETASAWIIGGIYLVLTAQVMTLGWLWKHQQPRQPTPLSAARMADLASRTKGLLRSKTECIEVPDVLNYAVLKTLMADQQDVLSDRRDFIGEACTEFMGANAAFWDNYDNLVTKVALDDYPHRDNKTMPIEFVSAYRGKCEMFNEPLQDASQAAILLWPTRYPHIRHARAELCRYMDVAEGSNDKPTPGLQWTQIEYQIRHAAHEVYLGQPAPDLLLPKRP